MANRDSILIRIFAPVILAWLPASVSAKATEAELVASDSAESGLTELTDPKLIDLYNKSVTANPADYCTILPMLSEMARRNFTGGVEKVQTEYQVQCAIDRKDWTEAYQGIKKWEALGGDKPPAQEWIFRLAFLAGEDDEALERLEIMTKLDDPKQLTSLPVQMLFALARRFEEDGQRDRVIQQYQMLYLSPHFKLLSPNIRSASALRMLEGKLKKADFGEVGELLVGITSPYSYITILADKSYEPIWPQIEQHVGANMANILGSYLREKKSAFELNPGDTKKKQEYGHALMFSGRFEEVIALAGTIDHSNAGSQNWDEEDGWLLNLEAYALNALGDTEAADRILDQFGFIDHQPEKNDWLVNFVINRALRLVDQRRWEEGLAAVQIAEEIAQKSGSPYANMLIRQGKLCALHGLDRSGEAKALLSEIVEHQDDSLTVAAQALLCVGERERAAELVVKGLQDDNKKDRMIEDLQKPEFELFYDDSSLPSIHGELRNHPDVAKLFDELARDIPEEYIPLVGVRRKKLAAERTAD